MREGELTYDDFLRRLNIQDVLIDAGYHLNRRDGLRMIQESRDAEYYAQKVPDNGGVYIVPAFTGLGAPYWDMYARGAIVGITRGTTQNHIIRAAEESIAYQSADLVAAMEKDIIYIYKHKCQGQGAQILSDICETI